MIFSQAKHANGENSWGLNGDTGKVVDMKIYGLYESASVKVINIFSIFLADLLKLPFFRSKLSKPPSR